MLSHITTEQKSAGVGHTVGWYMQPLTGSQPAFDWQALGGVQVMLVCWQAWVNEEKEELHESIVHTLLSSQTAGGMVCVQLLGPTHVSTVQGL